MEILLVILLLLGIVVICSFFINYLLEDKNKSITPERDKVIKENNKKKQNTKHKPEQKEIILLWKDKDWVQENLIDRKIITWKQYDYFKGKKGIYKFTINKYSKDGNTKIYVGQSNNLMQRLTTHIYSASHEYKKGEQYITSALRIQLQQDKWIEWSLIEFAKNQKELDEKERFYIALYSNELGIESLYNKDQGGVHY